MSEKPRVLFVCTANVCRSQMAEALLRLLAGDRFESLSAGVHPVGHVHRYARQVLEEVGAWSSRQHAKSVQEYLPPDGVPPALLVTLSEEAARHCSRLTEWIPHLHWPMPDPVAASGGRQERLAAFRWARDRICLRLEDALAEGQIEEALAAIPTPWQEEPRSGFERLLSGIVSAFQPGPSGRTS